MRDEKSRELRAWLIERYDAVANEEDKTDNGLELEHEIKIKVGRKTLIGILGAAGAAGLFGVGSYLGDAYYSRQWVHLGDSVECTEHPTQQPVVSRTPSPKDPTTSPSECQVDHQRK